jgi:hypothetical protein
MLGLPPSVRIYFAAELVDMRKVIDGLRAAKPADADHAAIIAALNKLHSRLYECPDCGRLA